MTGRSTGLGQTTIDGEVTKTTDSAVLFVAEVDSEEYWVPRSVCLRGARIEEGDDEITAADWWLKKEGLL